MSVTCELPSQILLGVNEDGARVGDAVGHARVPRVFAGGVRGRRANVPKGADAAGVALGEAALRRATHYANEREVFGRQIGANQAVSHPLAKAHMELNAAMTMMHRAAWHYDHGLECGELANTAKYLAAEASFFAADQAMQTHGGLGYASEYHVERYWREARLQRIAPVSQEMTLNYIAQNIMGLPRSY